MTFSDSDATRIIAALEARAEKKTRNGAQVQTTWGTVGAVDTAQKFASAYLYGETDGAYMSEGFRIPETMYLTVGDKVKVAMNYATGERWIAEKNVSSAYKKVMIDSDAGEIYFGVGSAAPNVKLYHNAASNRLVLDTIGTSGGLDLYSSGVADPYAAIRFLNEAGAGRIYLDYGTGTTDDFRILTATGTAGSETSTERLRVASSGKVTVLSNTDAVLATATSGAFQVGPDNAGNMLFDNNEIMARNNGAAADLFLNNEGGNVFIRSGGYTNIRGIVAFTFVFNGTLPGTGTQNLYWADQAAGAVNIRNAFNGEIVAISVKASADRTAGTLTAQCYNNSTATAVGPTAVLDGTNVNLKLTTVTGGAGIDINTTHQMICRVTTSGFTPVANNIVVVVWMQYYAE